MNKTKLAYLTILGLVFLGPVCLKLKADLPPDWPGVTVTTYDSNHVAPGYVFLAVASVTPGVGTYMMVLQNDGTPVWYEKLPNEEIYDFKVQPNGYLSCAPFIEPHSWTGGGDVYHEIRDDSYNLRETVTGGNGYVAEGHDFQVLPNGNILQFGYYMSEVDMSQIVAGGYPAARVAGGVIQELDAQRNVVWQWRSWDHYNFADELTSKSAVINAFHLNDIFLDIDGNLVVGTPTEIRKINRQTGDVMWTLGGPENEFTAVGPGADLSHFGGHATYRLENGNFLMYDNGNRQGTVSSKVHEYQLDEVAKTATHVWSYVPDTVIPAWHRGNAQRLPNGNTFIGWGGAQPSWRIPACTEVTPAGEKVFELFFNTNSPPVESYRAFRFVYPPATQKIEFTWLELATGNTYHFTNTGVTITVNSGGGGYNETTVTREPYAPVYPLFQGKAPLVLPVRVSIGSDIASMNVQLDFDALGFGFTNAADLKVYYRAQTGQGLFVQQTTGYNPGTRKLSAIVTLDSQAGDSGELVFGYPDVADVPYPPLLAEVENYRGVQTHEVIAPKLAGTGTVYSVNQERPILLSWSPKGFARWYHLQIATNADFASPIVDVPYQTEAFRIWSDAATNTTYFFRVKTWNDGGESDWSVGSFQTVVPQVQVMVPNGGEAWQRGLSYFIQWQDNVAEPVVIDLYKGGVFLRSLNTNSSAGAYQWEVALDLVPGNDYSIRVSSTTNASLYDISDLNFSIAGVVSVAVATDPAGLAVTVDGTNCTAPANFAWVSGSAHTLEAPSPQPAPEGHSRSVFASWSDGGAQTNVITVPFSATNYTATFSTQYLLDVAINPAGAGTVSNYPAGPWYDAGQLVSLSAQTNAGYRFNFWNGVDSSAGNTANVTMNGYRFVEAAFQPSNFPYIVVTNNGDVAPGQLIGNIGGRRADGTSTTYVILDNTGTNALFSSTTIAISSFVTPQGFDAVSSAGSFNLKDETLNVVDTVSTLGPTLDTHDIKILPNGHTLLFGQEFRTVDMSQVVPGGKPNANVTGDVIQELDADKRVVFEWHTFDHIAITNTFADMTQANFDYAHINSVTIDPMDNNLLASLRTTSEIVKINRQTGEVMWRLGGKMNQFTFINEHAENAPYYTVGQHDIHRLPNGNLLYFDNGNISGGGITPNDRTYSRAVEYALDETNMTATLVWEFRHTPDISPPCTGAVKRFENGNTLINWGCAISSSGFIVTEVNQAGDVVFEMKHRQTGGISSVLLGGGLTKQFWNDPALVRAATFQNITSGQFYDSPDAGVSVAVFGMDGAPENALVMERHLDAARFPSFPGKAPQVLMEHVVLATTNIVSMVAVVGFELPHTSYPFDAPIIHDPAQVVVYHRPTPGQGVFSALPTTYYPELQMVLVPTAPMGEFIFGYPDVEDVAPSVPVISSPADGSEVNQAAPAVLSWIPQGLVSSFDLQIGTNADFSNLILDTNNLGSTSFALQDLLPNAQYFWRVRLVNQAGASGWASASFTTVPPLLHLTYPAGGEVWQRFQVVNIQWEDNLAENVKLEMYKGGVFNRTFVFSTPSSGSYTWTVGLFQGFPPGSDYTIRISSTTDTNLYDFSEPFTIINPPTFDASAVTLLSDGRVQLGLSVPGALGATVLGSTNLVDWEVLQSLPLTNGAAVFTDDAATGLPCRFYRLRVP